MTEDVTKQDTTSRKTEEITDIIERMPTSFARVITWIVCFIVIVLLSFGFIIKYPDIVTGEVSISAHIAPLKLVAEQNGRLRLNKINSQDKVRTGQLLAWIDNPADPTVVDSIKQLVGFINLPTDEAHRIYEQLPKSLNLGDLTMPYTTLLSGLKQLADYQENRLYAKQEKALSDVLKEQEKALSVLQEKERLSHSSLELTNKFLGRDSILFAKKVISLSEFEQSISRRISSEDQFQSAVRNSGIVREQISNTKSSLQQNRITDSEKQLQLDLDVRASHNNLIDQISAWEKRYLIVSPMDGQVQFLKFWNDQQFIQAGEQLFSVIPEQNSLVGKVHLPVSGAGKVKRDQDVIVKLADYPYMEYGYIKAKVKDIALVSSTINTNNGAMESYLVTLDFPDLLKTNYGTVLDFRYEALGMAEIITKDRRLIERFFDNLKYIGHSN